MTSNPPGLRHALLERCGVPHRFGVRGEPQPPGMARPRQVHGKAVATAVAPGRVSPSDADAVVSTLPGVVVGVVTADCLPLLVCAEDGSAVAAIHAGWRGLAQGVIADGIAALRACAPPGARLVAAIGPHIGPCCYEVDAPVFEALRSRFGAELEAAQQPTRPGHARLDLAALAAAELTRAGLASVSQGCVQDACTQCDSDRFHSYRRDGPRAGRLIHHIGVRAQT